MNRRRLEARAREAVGQIVKERGGLNRLRRLLHPACQPLADTRERLQSPLQRACQASPTGQGATVPRYGPQPTTGLEGRGRVASHATSLSGTLAWHRRHWLGLRSLGRPPRTPPQGGRSCEWKRYRVRSECPRVRTLVRCPDSATTDRQGKCAPFKQRASLGPCQVECSRWHGSWRLDQWEQGALRGWFRRGWPHPFLLQSSTIAVKRTLSALYCLL